MPPAARTAALGGPPGGSARQGARCRRAAAGPGVSGGDGAAAGLAVRGLPLRPEPGAGPGRRGRAGLRSEALRAPREEPGAAAAAGGRRERPKGPPG